MISMRLFLAIELSNDVRSHLLEVRKRLEAGLPKISYTRADNFHITGRPGVDVATGRRFRGNKTWMLRLRPGTYRYRSDQSRSHMKGTLSVLAAGRTS